MRKEGLGFCSVPTLGFEGKFVAIARDELCAFGSGGDVTDDFDIGQGFHTLVVGEGHGEEEFVVLTTIEGTGGDIEVELLGCDCRLVVDGQAFLKDATTHLTFVADVEKFAADAIAHIDHGSGADACLTQTFDHIATCLGFEQALEEVLLSREVGLEIERIAGFLRFGSLHLREVDGFFALHELKSHISRSKIA